MDGDENFTKDDLQNCSYRYLQQKAKSMHLPSNVKKVNLVQMIYAKRYQPEEVNGIVEKVKRERLQMSQFKKENRKKNHVQDAEISSTSQSPPITMTPKRTSNLFIRYSPEHRRMPKHILQSSSACPTTIDDHVTKTSNGSDRVLRSFNIKTRKSNYRVLNSVISVLKAENDSLEDEIRVVTQDKRSKLNMTAKCIVKKNAPVTSSSICLHKKNNNTAFPKASKTQKVSSMPLIRANMPRFTLKNSQTQQNAVRNLSLKNDSQNKRFFLSRNNLPSSTITTADASLLKVNAQIQKSDNNISFGPTILNTTVNDIPKSSQAIVSANISTFKRNTQANQNIMTVNIRKNVGLPKLGVLKDKLNVNNSNQNNQTPCTSGYRTNERNVLQEVQMQIVPTSGILSTPARRQRTLSGIYPITTQESNYNFKQIGLEFRGIDGKLAKVNALVAKPLQKSLEKPDLSIQDIMDDYVIDPEAYPNMSALTDVLPDDYDEFDDDSFNTEESFSIYKGEENRNDKTLPVINSVFSRFSGSKDLTQPLYVQVSDESERSLPYPIYVSKTQENTTLLETVYNFKNQFLTHQPLRSMATTTNTKCVQSTPVITTPIQQPATMTNQYSNIASCEQDRQFNIKTDFQIPKNYNLSKYTEDGVLEGNLTHYEELSMTSSIDTSQELGANVTIPEMVEDALEIISQDGDYMERIGMDIRMQCILCSWAGPKIILEIHIRNEHNNQIHKEDKKEWNITYSLGNLVQQEQWLSEVIDHDSTLYVISAKYEDPDCFMSTITTLSNTDIPMNGTMTLYNKVSGEPYSWQGEIQPLPTNMPYENSTNCLKLELSKLNLLPNSANLTLRNRELVLKSPSKVVVGHPELHDIHLILFVTVS